MKKILTLAVLGASLTGMTQAALVANWAAPGVVTVTDLVGDNSSGGPATDILSIKFVVQGNTNFFLMTIAAAPTIPTFSEGYMLNFDYASGGANASGSYYIASGLVGIDELVDAHYFQNIVVGRHNHEFIGGIDPQFNTQSQASLGISYNTDGTGTQLEWAIPANVLPNYQAMTVYGSTLNPSVGGKTTYDTTNGLNFTPVPEPSVMSLLVGAAALGLRRRSRA